MKEGRHTLNVGHMSPGLRSRTIPRGPRAQIPAFFMVLRPEGDGGDGYLKEPLPWFPLSFYLALDRRLTERLTSIHLTS